MTPTPLTIWCNQPFNEPAAALLREGVGPHSLLYRPGADTPNSELEAAQIAFGKPALASLTKSETLRWVQVASAGFTPWDTESLWSRLCSRGVAFTRSSRVYSEPCAQHVLSLMLSWARRLPWAIEAQLGQRSWRYREMREESRLLNGQTVVIVGLGSIGLRLIELLEPFAMHIVAVRSSPRGDEPVLTLGSDDNELSTHLATADHVVNLLPLNQITQGFFSAERLGQIREGAVFYNIGRGGTVDQQALLALLNVRHFSAVLLDVTEPEPLPPTHPLWNMPGCYITPHSAGGHHEEQLRLVRHFLDNLKRFEQGTALLDRVV